MKPYPINYVKVYGISALYVERNDIPLEVWMKQHGKEILFDNYKSSMRFDHEKNIFVIRYECPDVYESECNIAIP
jgi:hypothetical protein